MKDNSRPNCPECGEPLSVFLEEDEKTGQIKVNIGCEGDADDEFELDIMTGLYEEDLDGLSEGKEIKMRAHVTKRRSDPTLSDVNG